jgi:hypothetical protein
LAFHVKTTPAEQTTAVMMQVVKSDNELPKMLVGPIL